MSDILGVTTSGSFNSMVLIDVIEEHLEEFDFLWQQRTNALRDRNYTFARLVELEERIVAHLDGLALGGEDAWKLLEPKLTNGDRGEAFAAGSVALESEDDGVAALVCDRLGMAVPSLRVGIQDAFYHASHARIDPMIRKLLHSDRPTEKTAAIDILSFRRASLDRNDLRVSLRNNNMEVVRAALLAIARLRMTHIEGNIRPLLISDNMALRQEAVRTGLVVGIDSALDEARQVMLKATGQAGQMAILIGQVGHARDLPLLVETMKDPALARNAITALGLLGYIEAIPALIESTANREMARLAGEAMQLITGLDVEKEGLAVTNASPHENDGEEEFEEDPDDALPWPDREMVAAWWHAQKPQFEVGIRYRYGKLYGATVLLDSLENSSLPHRHHAAFELALCGQHFPYIETSAFAHSQRKQLATLNAAGITV